MTRTKFPKAKVQLDGNAFAILGHVARALHEAGASEADVSAYMKEATGGDYNHLLRVTTRWVAATSSFCCF